MNSSKSNQPKNDAAISDKMALEHINKLDSKIKAKNTTIIILVILLIGFVSAVGLHHFRII